MRHATCSINKVCGMVKPFAHAANKRHDCAPIMPHVPNDIHQFLQLPPQNYCGIKIVRMIWSCLLLAIVLAPTSNSLRSEYDNTLLDSVAPAYSTLVDRPYVAHGRIPEEDYLVKNVKTYYPFAGPLRHIKEEIEHHKHAKWGFLIYRTDYTSDSSWERFLSHLNQETEMGLNILKAPPNLQDTLEMTIKEDKASLDGATPDQVRDLFKAWVKSPDALAEMHNEPCAVFTYPRYTYCVHIDGDVLDSINRAPEPEKDVRMIAYVNLVRLRLEDFDEDYKLHLEQSIKDCEEDEECILDDEDLRDQDFARVPLSYLGPEAYDELYNQFTFERYVRYERSDGVSWGGGGYNPEDTFGRTEL
jgi:hypothetical protein